MTDAPGPRGRTDTGQTHPGPLCERGQALPGRAGVGPPRRF